MLMRSIGSIRWLSERWRGTERIWLPLARTSEAKVENHGTVFLYVDAINTIIDNLKACGKKVNKDDE